MSDNCQICGQTCSPERAVTLDYLGEPVQACPDCARTRMSSLNQQMRALRKERKAIGRQIGDVPPNPGPPTQTDDHDATTTSAGEA